MKSPRSRIKMRLPVGASAWARVPPPAPEPMTMTSKWSGIGGSGSDQGGGADSGAGGPRQLRVGQHQQGLPHPVAGQFIQVQVLDDDHTPPGVEGLGDDE